ncbi:MAG: DUF5320 domain-containing protein [Candidatus Thermoplasmatota archaeon]|nr:DUF5320 domain-containing protein [Candidatus Thermoplasmatota archaeon]
MPGGDRTGPLGHGPMTGRALGYCSGSNIPGYANPGFGRGLGRGLRRGFGRGFRGRIYGEPYNLQQPSQNVYPQPTRDEEKTYLEDTIKRLDEEMRKIKERLQELSKE